MPQVMDVLNASELQELEELISKASFSRSTVLDATMPTSPIRTSSSAGISYDAGTVPRKLRRVACEYFGVPETHAEPMLHAAKYEKEQQYRSHHDACCDGSSTCKAFQSTGGNRLGTMLLYVNDDFIGGGTEFNFLGITVKPRAGRAVLWHALGCPEEAIHAGLPVESGTKRVVTTWLRERPWN